MARSSRTGGSTGGPANVEVITTLDGFDRIVTTTAPADGTDGDSLGSLTEPAPGNDTASSGLNGRLQRVAQRLTNLIALLPTALGAGGGLKVDGSGTALPVSGTLTANAGTNLNTSLLALEAGNLATISGKLPTALTVGALALKTGRLLATPTSVLTRSANTTAYATGQLIASNTTAGSVVVPSFAAVANALGWGSIKRLRLFTNKTSGMAGIQINVDLWSAAPTFTNGDGAAYAVATGAASYLGSAQVTLSQAGDGAFGIAMPNVGDAINFALASGTAIFWSLSAVGAFTPASGQTFTLQPEIQQD